MSLSRILLLFFLALATLNASRINLYLKDGGDLKVSEYEIVDDRVRYYSVERSQWEEIPLDLVDLERTRREEEQQAAIEAARARENAIEEAAERRARTELHNVPLEDGVYHLAGEEIVPVKQREVTLDSSGKRTLLQVISPVPIIAGKTSVEIEGAASEFVVTTAKPMFYVRLEKISRFGIVRAKPKKKVRVVQVIQTVPKTKEMWEEQDEVEVFRQQLAPSVYKVWPVEPLEQGEYAFIEFTPGEANSRVWDFAYRGSAAPASAP